MDIVKKKPKQTFVTMWRKGNPPTWFMGMEIGAVTVENSMEASH